MLIIVTKINRYFKTKLCTNLAHSMSNQCGPLKKIFSDLFIFSLGRGQNFNLRIQNRTKSYISQDFFTGLYC